MECSGRIDPEDVHDYIAEGGLRPWRRCWSGARPASLEDHRGLSGLRGGAADGGFPTGAANRHLAPREQRDLEKVVICNADKGDPGAYMDALLESNPRGIFLEGIDHLRPHGRRRQGDRLCPVRIPPGGAHRHARHPPGQGPWAAGPGGPGVFARFRHRGVSRGPGPLSAARKRP